MEDYPSLPFRAMHIPLRPPAPYGESSVDDVLEVYEAFLRLLGRYKYNHLFFLILANVTLESRPDVWGSTTFEAAHVRRLVEAGRRHGVRINPEVKTVGKFFRKSGGHHLSALQKQQADLLEPPEEGGSAPDEYSGATAFRLGDPAVFELTSDVVEEIYRLFEEPPYVHVGGDEANNIGNATPEADPGTLLADYVNRMSAFVQDLGAEPMLWYDLLVSGEDYPDVLSAHGGPPKNTASALDRLDSDLTGNVWAYWTNRFPVLEPFAEKGFSVVGGSWFRADNVVNFARAIQRREGAGLMGTAWGVHVAKRFVEDGGDLGNHEAERKTRIRREPGVFATTAEGVWSPERAPEVLATYSPLLRVAADLEFFDVEAVRDAYEIGH
jgi:hypothetical protein